MRKALEGWVLGDVIDRDIETGRIGQVEDIEAVLHGHPLGDLSYLHERNVRAPLPRLPEDIALAVIDEVGLIRIIGGNRAIERAGAKQRQAETGRIERRCAARPRSSSDGLLRRAVVVYLLWSTLPSLNLSR